MEEPKKKGKKKALHQHTPVPWLKQYKNLPPEGDLINVEHVAQLLNISTRTVHRRVLNQDLPSTKIGGVRKFSKALILRILYSRMR
jgi:excisionase family DNA binding protein